MDKSQSRSVNLVRAGLHDKVEDAAASTAVFGAHAGGLDFEFLERLDGRAGLAKLSSYVDGGVGSVKHDGLREGRAAIDAAFPIVPANTRRQFVGEILGIPAAGESKRQIVHTPAGQYAADLRRFRLQQRRRCADLYGFRDSAEFHLDVHPHYLGYAQGHRFPNVSLELWRMKRKLVCPDREIGNGISAGFVRYGLIGGVCS